LLHHVANHADRNGEGETDGATAASVDLGIDPHHLAVEIEQRASRVTGIDGDIRLDEGNIILVALGRQAAPLGTDDACGYRVVQAEGPFADFEIIFRGQLQYRQALGVDAQQREVGTRIGTDDLGVEFPAVAQSPATTWLLVTM
jgi:hypothetical protein